MIILGKKNFGLFLALHEKLGKIELEDWMKKEEEFKGQRGFM